MRGFRFKYLGKDGIEDRIIKIESVSYLDSPGEEHQSGWFLNGFCLEKEARRSFALTRIIMENTSSFTIPL